MAAPKKSTASKARKANQYADETKPAKFSRVAGGRLNKALDVLDALAACARSKSMEFTPEQAQKIRATLEQAVASVVRAYTQPATTKGKDRVAL